MLVSGCSDGNLDKTVATGRGRDLQGSDGRFAGRELYGAMLTFQNLEGSRYVRWSALAKLRIADSLFFNGKYQEAKQEYEGFLLQHQ